MLWILYSISLDSQTRNFLSQHCNTVIKQWEGVIPYKVILIFIWLSSLLPSVKVDALILTVVSEKCILTRMYHETESP